MMDARRNQVYIGIYRFEQEFEIVEEQMAIAVQELIEKLNAYGEKVTFLGDGVPVYAKQLEEGLKVPYSFAPTHVNRQRAAKSWNFRYEIFCRGQDGNGERTSAGLSPCLTGRTGACREECQSFVMEQKKM